VHAGSDVVLAFTYYGHREKLRLIGKEDLLEPLNREALAPAIEVARETGSLAAGDLCNTNIYTPDRESELTVRRMFDEQTAWIAEAGADVVGLNCWRGPRTLLPLVQRVRDTLDGHVAALPVPYRTTPEQPSFQSLRDPGCDCLPGDRPFPTALDPFYCNRYEIEAFGREALAMGVNYLGVCCGAGSHHIRSLAEGVGKAPPASRFSPDMSKHAYLGTDALIKDHNRAYSGDLQPNGRDSASDRFEAPGHGKCGGGTCGCARAGSPEVAVARLRCDATTVVGQRATCLVQSRNGSGSDGRGSG
jgi:betaine-homocysteine S-methyltransferase